jgi:hypothetical protein
MFGRRARAAVFLVKPHFLPKRLPVSNPIPCDRAHQGADNEDDKVAFFQHASPFRNGGKKISESTLS